MQRIGYICFLLDYLHIFFSFLGGYSLSVRQIIKKRLPILAWLPAYTFGTFLQDVLAGFTVGLTEIPQGIAYALVAGKHFPKSMSFLT